jgi:DnaA family protein
VKQLPLAVTLRTNAVFASFVAGDNREAVSALEQLAPDRHAPLVWLHGAPGTGRTHLLQAVCAHAGARARRASYIPLEEIRALGPGVLAGLEALDYVCLDDFEAIARDAAWERGIFALHIALFEAGGRLVIAGDRAPLDAGIGLPDLRSRAAGGIVLRLRILSEPQQLEAARLRAAQRGLELPDDVARFLQQHLRRDTATLCATIDSLDVAALAAGRRLTLPFVRALLGPAAPSDA